MRRVSIVGAMMFAAATLAIAMTPDKTLVGDVGNFDLQGVIPTELGDWKVAAAAAVLDAVDPRQGIAESDVYEQVVMRTYERQGADNVMLAVAYGRDKRSGSELHSPEVCYTAQGFQVLSKKGTSLAITGDQVPATRMVAVKGSRVEFITYWIVVGEKAVSGKLMQKLTKLQYGLSGKLVGSVLVRVSSIGRDENAAYELQEQFINELINSITGEYRAPLIGVRRMADTEGT